MLLDLSQGVPDDLVAFEWEVICRERCTVALLVPSQLLQIIDLCEQGKGSQWKLRVISSGGQPLRKKHMEAIGQIADSIHVCYGSTETGAVSCKVRSLLTALPQGEVSPHHSPLKVRSLITCLPSW